MFACAPARLTFRPRELPSPRLKWIGRVEQLLNQFLEHLRYERNVSEHTLRNYASDLTQFLDYLGLAHPRTGKRNLPPIAQIDHITIREWLATLHSARETKASVAR